MPTPILDADLPDTMSCEADPVTVAEIADLFVEINDNRQRVLYGRYTLLALTALEASSAYLLYREGGEPLEQLLTGGAMAGGYLLCALFTIRYHMAGLAAGLGVYLAGNLVTLTINPDQFTQGWGLKVAIVTGLALGLYAALERRKLIRRLSDLPVKGFELDMARKMGKL